MSERTLLGCLIVIGLGSPTVLGHVIGWALLAVLLVLFGRWVLGN